MKHCLVVVLLIVAGCGGRDARYRALVDAELASGKKADTLLYGIRLGMSRKDFFNYVWQLHQKDSFDDGSNSTAVLYRLRHQLKQPAQMLFYPMFRQDTIYRMWASFHYDAWAPWNKGLWADSLMPDVLRLYRQWYPGNDFIRLDDPSRGTIYVKVDGNRRIVVGQKDDANVNVDYTDLLVEKNMK